jgi:hypothetical protein
MKEALDALENNTELQKSNLISHSRLQLATEPFFAGKDVGYLQGPSEERTNVILEPLVYSDAWLSLFSRFGGLVRVSSEIQTI